MRGETLVGKSVGAGAGGLWLLFAAGLACGQLPAGPEGVSLQALFAEASRLLSQPAAAPEDGAAEGEGAGEGEGGGGDVGEGAGGGAGGGAGVPGPAVAPGEIERLRDSVRVSEFDLVELHVANENLAAVLQLLSIQSERNIVAGRDVQATVTADLYGVTFYEALDAILHVNGFGYVERGNFVYVYTRAELEAIEQAGRAPVSRVIRLDYLNAPDAARFVAPLLSETGQITAPNQTIDFGIPDDSPVGKDDYASDAVIVVTDFPERVAEIERLVRELDTRPAQVLVEATILQTSVTEANAFGLDVSVIADLSFSDFVSPLDATDGLINGRGSRLAEGAEEEVAVPADGEGRALGTNVGNVAGEGTFKFGIVDEDVAVFLRVLDEVTDVTVISNPKILTLNRQPARVLVGTRVGYLNTTTTETATTQTVEFLDTGTQLHIRPFVTSDGLIRLELKPQVSTATPRATTTATGQVVTIPDEDTTELVTNLLVRDGQTVVLGGLFTETTTAARRQVPLLGDIPLIGAAFRGNDDSTRRSEIIFLITPSIVNDRVLTLEGERATEYVDHARVGAREGLLPWSRERQVGQLLIEAERLAAEGRRDAALLKVQRALALQPQSPDAVALRDRLGVAPVDFPTRSMLDGVFAPEGSRPGEAGTAAPAGVEPVGAAPAGGAPVDSAAG